MLRRFSVFILAFLIIPSFTSASEEEPADSPNARVRFATHTRHIATLYRYEDSSCLTGETKLLSLRSGRLRNSKTQRLGLPLWDYHENGATEIVVAPGYFVGRFEGLIDVGIATSTCIHAFSLDIQPGKDYEVLFEHSGRHCLVIASEIKEEQGNFHKVLLEPSTSLGDSCTKRKFRW